MTTELSVFAARVRDHIGFWSDEFSLGDATNDPAYRGHMDIEFGGLAVMLFTLQYKNNPAYQRLCDVRGIKPSQVNHWTEIPCVPTAAFKELELTCLHPEDRTHVFHSSGTTEQRPSRHFHNADSLALYEASLWPWLCENLRLPISDFRLLSLTPLAEQTPHSSLVHMFDYVRRKMAESDNAFVGRVAEDGSWYLDFNAALSVLRNGSSRKPLLVLGTAFSYVHLLDELEKQNIRLMLPANSRVLETGGYKGRSRTMPKAELHQLITERLGVSAESIICEYGMSELSSQAYEVSDGREVSGVRYQVSGEELHVSGKTEVATRRFRFPPWARARVISPENGREVGEGEVGLLQVFDLANVFSVQAIQTEDLARRCGDGFELIGRASAAEARGCSLMPGN